MRRIRSVGTASAAAIVLGIASGPTVANAQETISLTFLSGFPPAATFVGAFIEGYVPAVDAQLAKTGNYKIDWNLAHSGQIVKPRGEFEGVEQGLGDLGDVTTAFHFDRVPLYKAPYVTPFTTKEPALLAETYIELQARFPQFGETWAKYNQVPFGTTANVDNYVLISSSQLKALDDLKGKKVGAAGANLPWLTPIGVAGVSTNLADAYNSLKTGIYNAMIAWPQAMGAFKLCEPAPYALDATLGSASIHVLTANAAVWDGLPDEVKQTLADNARVWNEEQIERLVDGAAEGLERCREDFGMTYTEMEPAERVRWAKSLPNLAQEWTAELEKNDLPGKEILGMYMDRMRAAKQPIARHWDRE